MATVNDDILIDNNGDEQVINGDFAIGDGSIDDCLIIMKLNTGALKSDPILGPNLITLINKHNGALEAKQAIKLHLNRDKKTFKKLEITNGKIVFEL